MIFYKQNTIHAARYNRLSREDGYSGTSFEHPAFQRMMEAALDHAAAAPPMISKISSQSVRMVE